MTRKKEWWRPEYDFFGDFYMEGDDSIGGYLIEKEQSLQERTEEEVLGVIGLTELKLEEHVVDIPCGYGRHSIELSSKGYTVTGIDLNQRHLEIAKKKAKEAELRVTFLEDDMKSFKLKEKADVLINMFYSFGFFESDKDNEGVLRNFYENLNVNGRFLMHTDVNVPRILSGKYKNHEIRSLASGKKLIINDRYDPFDKKIYGEWIIRDAEKEIAKRYEVRVYEKDEFEDLCKKVGFSEVRTFSDWSGAPYTKDSEDMIVVARKQDVYNKR